MQQPIPSPSGCVSRSQTNVPAAQLFLVRSEPVQLPGRCLLGGPNSFCLDVLSCVSQTVMPAADSFKPTATCPWPLLTQQQLDKSPSRSKKFTKEVEASRRQTFLETIVDTCELSAIMLSAILSCLRRCSHPDCHRPAAVLVLFLVSTLAITPSRPSGHNGLVYGSLAYHLDRPGLQMAEWG